MEYRFYEKWKRVKSSRLCLFFCFFVVFVLCFCLVLFFVLRQVIYCNSELMRCSIFSWILRSLSDRKGPSLSLSYYVTVLRFPNFEPALIVLEIGRWYREASYITRSLIKVWSSHIIIGFWNPAFPLPIIAVKLVDTGSRAFPVMVLSDLLNDVPFCFLN